MRFVRTTLLNALSYFMATVIVVAILIAPITFVLWCIKLIMTMFGG